MVGLTHHLIEFPPNHFGKTIISKMTLNSTILIPGAIFLFSSRMKAASASGSKKGSPFYPRLKTLR